jgi:hypothetical protein
VTDKERSEFLRSSVFQEYQKRVEAYFEATDARLEANEKLRMRENELLAQQVTQAKATMEFRLEGMNELRKQISDERGRYVEVKEFNPKIDGILDRLSRIDLRVANWDGRFWMLGAGLTGLVVLLQLAVNWVRK